MTTTTPKTTPNPLPNGRREIRDGTSTLVVSRTFEAPIETVWAAVTESDRTARWIGPWRGDPESGRIELQMTVEEGAGWEPGTILACQAPRLLALRTGSEPDGWHLSCELTETADGTRLDFCQHLDGAEFASQVGPGWEYYLDRLVAAETGADRTQSASTTTTPRRPTTTDSCSADPSARLRPVAP